MKQGVVEVSKWLKRYDAQLSSVFQAVGLDLAREVTLSRRAASCAGEGISGEQFTRQEFSISTRGLITLVLYFAMSRHTKDDRERGEAALAAVLRSAADTQQLQADTWETSMGLDLAAAAHCQAKAQPNSRHCTHLEKALDISACRLLGSHRPLH